MCWVNIFEWLKARQSLTLRGKNSSNLAHRFCLPRKWKTSLVLDEKISYLMPMIVCLKMIFHLISYANSLSDAVRSDGIRIKKCRGNWLKKRWQLPALRHPPAIANLIGFIIATDPEKLPKLPVQPVERPVLRIICRP